LIQGLTARFSEAKRDMSIPQRTLGRTNLQVSVLGFGSMGLRGPRTWGVRVASEELAEQVLNTALDLGINFIDTSPDYGLAEERIGKYLSHRRDEFILATKCGCTPIQHSNHLEVRHSWTRDTLRGNVDQSLTRLRCEAIDILQLHGGNPHTAQQAGLIDEMQSLQRAGKVRFLGVSSSLPEIIDFAQIAALDVFQLPYSCLIPEHETILRALAADGRGTIIRGGIARGGPEAEIQRPEVNEAWKRAQLDRLLPAGMSKAEFILRQTLSHPACHTTIVGTANLTHLRENAAAASSRLGS
jgi:aryl-alcohol dehydrogenase-like predicted oxidoreductase